MDNAIRLLQLVETLAVLDDNLLVGFLCMSSKQHLIHDLIRLSITFKEDERRELVSLKAFIRLIFSSGKALTAE